MGFYSDFHESVLKNFIACFTFNFWYSHDREKPVKKQRVGYEEHTRVALDNLLISFKDTRDTDTNMYNICMCIHTHMFKMYTHIYKYIYMYIPKKTCWI